MTPFPIVLVSWIDSSSSCGWQDPDEVHDKSNDRKRLECVTAGFLIAETKIGATIAQSLSNSEYADCITIPRCAIKSIRKIGPKHDPKTSLRGNRKSK